MKYDKELLISNLKYLISYGYEPEVTITLKSNERIFLVAYETHIDLSTEFGETTTLHNVEDIFAYICFEDILEMEGDIDFEFPIQCQSIVVDERLWIDSVLPKQVISKFKTKFSVVRGFSVNCLMVIFIYFMTTISNTDSFDTSAIIACSVLGGFIIVMMIFFTIYDSRRNKIIKKYYGVVSEEDKQIASQLLDKISIVDHNEYDFYDLFRYDLGSSDIEASLKLLIKGKKIYIDSYEPIKAIEQELLYNNMDNKYNDIEFNEYIFEFVKLLERNLCDL